MALPRPQRTETPSIEAASRASIETQTFLMALPSRGARASPIFRASLVQTFAALRPLSVPPLAPSPRVGDTPLLAPCRPCWRGPGGVQGVFGDKPQHGHSKQRRTAHTMRTSMNAANESNNNIQPVNLAFIQNLVQPQPRQQDLERSHRRQRSQLLIEQLGGRDTPKHSPPTSPRWAASINYSLSGTVLEIAQAAMPSASRVAGLYAWNQLGRKVKKGERRVSASLPPWLAFAGRRIPKPKREITKQNEPVLVGFRSGLCVRCFA